MEEIIQANTPVYQRHRIMKSQVKRFKSPKLSGMYTVAIPELRITYYIKTAKRYKAKIAALIKANPERMLICKTPK
jgi:hypothetical protein